MALYKCTNCGYEYDKEIHEQPQECPFCKANVDDIPDLWDEME